MKKRLIIAGISLAAWAGFSEDLQQQFETAYFLETAKGNSKDAATIYQHIADRQATEENRAVIKKSLIQLLKMANTRQNEKTIREYQEKLLLNTDTCIQELIDLTKEEGIIYLPEGEFEGIIKLEKPVTLKGRGPDKTVLTATANEPLIWVTPKQSVRIDSLTLKSQLATSEKTDPPGCALYLQDAKLILENCQLEALGNTKRSPVGFFAKGFSTAEIINCKTVGYEYPVFFSEGTAGKVFNSVIQNPGHCGIMTHQDSEVTIEGNMVTGSDFHGVRSTGGTIFMRNNLIIDNRNRGIYLGNKSAKGIIENNVIFGNGTGISCFEQSDVEMINNVVANNEHAGIDSRPSCPIKVKQNIITGNQSGFTVYDQGSERFRVEKNTFWNNGVMSKDHDLASSNKEIDPQFTAPEKGDFSVKNKKVAEHGLTEPETIKPLWNQYTALKETTL